MNNEEIAGLSLVEYVDLLEGMAVLNGSTPAEVNFDYCFWHGVISKERFEEAKWALTIRKVVGEEFVFGPATEFTVVEE